MDKRQELALLQGRQKEVAAEASDLLLKIKSLKDSMQEDALGIKIGDKVAYVTRRGYKKPSKEVTGILIGFASYASAPLVQAFKVDGTLGKVVKEIIYDEEVASLRRIGGSHA